MLQFKRTSALHRDSNQFAIQAIACSAVSGEARRGATPLWIASLTSVQTDDRLMMGSLRSVSYDNSCGETANL
jgi:hypothetical protein